MRLFRAFTNTLTSARLLVELSVGHIKKTPFSDEAFAELEDEIIKLASSHGLELRTDQEDRDGVSIDFRFMQLVLDLAGDPEVALGSLSPEIRVGPGNLLSTNQSDASDFRSKWTLWNTSTRHLHLWKNRYSRCCTNKPRGDRSLFFRSRRPRRDIQLWLLLLLVQTAKRSEMDGSLHASSSMGRTTWR